MVRQAFIAPPGKWFFAADYKQLEFRIAAHESGDQKLLEYIVSGRDVHREMASIFFEIPLDEVTDEQRFEAKCIVFGTLYLKRAESLAEEYGLTLEVARWRLGVIFENFPRLKEWLEETYTQALLDGYVRHSNGRIRRFPVITHMNANEIKRKAVNSPIQGLASDICVTSAATLNTEHYPRIDIRLLVHDAINGFVNEGDIEAINILRETMTHPQYEISVPLEVDIEVSDRWYGEKIKL